MDSFYQAQYISTALDQISLGIIRSIEKNDENRQLKLAVGFTAGGLAYVNLQKAMEKKGEGISNAYWNVLSTIAGTGVGVMVFSEKLTQKQVLGIVLGCISLYLMDGV